MLNKLEKHYIFVYGTLKDRDIQQALFGKKFEGRQAELEGWGLYMCEDMGYLFIKPELSGKVKGLILEINRTQMDIADLWESVPLYCREKVQVLSESGKNLEVWTYTRRLANGPRASEHELALHDKEFIIDEIRKSVAS